MKLTFALIIFNVFFINAFAQNTKTIKCDSIYKNKGITIKLKNFDTETDGYNDEKNSILIISQKINNKSSVLVKDSIFSSAQKIEFQDFNYDGIKDILIQNISDVRSNWTYNLYLYNSKTSDFIKIIGFEEIKNPTYNVKYNIVESYATSGQDWVSFYKIKKNRIYDYGITIVDDHGKNFEKEYQKAIKKISAKK
ncbi:MULTISPECIES: XAC2610-related protein [Flavobacterium]|uniref:Uncharacterized protein n=2 Tax=Flavobacterium TaxID=237 RepID=A0A6V6YZC8_9FLAO|nr:MULTISPECIES: hypothetical protein [Flavobacterium]OOV19009.1 hypothetical protein BXU10_04855 [Flavobacterium sp. LM4]CAD0004186.1 hypothetical protein FLAT13_02096 [Flavobacterium salmonis]CAD0004887.1 hypothetical protein FLACHUCJ7_02107 [Flavobacterium chungangense]